MHFFNFFVQRSAYLKHAQSWRRNSCLHMDIFLEDFVIISRATCSADCPSIGRGGRKGGGGGGGAVGSLPAWPVPGSTCLHQLYSSPLSLSFYLLSPSPPSPGAFWPEYHEKRVIYKRHAHWPASRLNCPAIGGDESVFLPLSYR